jgi:hypothetical protein
VTVIARCNGTQLVEDGRTLGLVEQGGGWLGTAVFVTVLVAAIVGVNGVAFAAMGNLAVGAGMIGGALVPAALAVAFLRAKRRRAAAPPGRPWLVFDLDARTLRDEGGAVIAPLDQVRLARTWQAGSSSKALTARHAGGRIVIARGTPFGDAVDDLERALAARGIRTE